jgi:hypothetical protein
VQLALQASHVVNLQWWIDEVQIGMATLFDKPAGPAPTARGLILLAKGGLRNQPRCSSLSHVRRARDQVRLCETIRAHCVEQRLDGGGMSVDYNPKRRCCSCAVRFGWIHGYKH